MTTSKQILPQRMNKDSFRKAAIAVPIQGEHGVWQVYLGHDFLGRINGESGIQAVDDMHLVKVHRALIKHMIGKGSGDTSDLPSSSALADYPDLVTRNPRAVWMVLVREREEREQALSKERQAISALVEMVEELMNGRTSKKDLAELVTSKLKPARQILQSTAEVSEREDALEKVLRHLLDSFDSGGIEGGQQMFELARSFVETSGTPTFSTWMAGVASCISSDEVDPSSYRVFYEKGMTPSEAVLAERQGTGVTQH